MSSSFIGKVIDNYRILESLGIGGMGVVFKAVNTRLDKLVALKMIAPGLAMNDNFIKRFQKEAKALAKLADPNIVAVYDLRQENDQWYIVMEYVDGPNLIDKIKAGGALKQIEAISIIKQVLMAIDHAHSVNIVHRDIKPNNVMVRSDGKVKITDFGLAKDTSISSHSISVDSGGTLFYMSPEHVKGISKTDKRSDIYSIGMTFYEMLSGQVPFQNMDSDFDIRETIVRKELIRPTSFNKNIPDQLEKIVMKAIQKNPDERYQSALEMLEDVEEFESTLTGVAYSRTGKTKKYKKNRGRIVTFKNIVIASSILFVAVALFFIPLGNFPDEESTSIVEISKEMEQDPKEIKKETIQPINSSAVQATVKSKEQSSPDKTTIKPIAKEPLVETKSDKQAIKGSDKPSIATKEIIKTGYVVVKLFPNDASVKLDNKPIVVNSNPFTINKLSAGFHKLEISKPGFTTFLQNIKIDEKVPLNLSVELDELIGKITIRVKPWGSIYVDNVIQKANTDRKVEIVLPEKKYWIKIVHPTFGEWKKQVSVIHDNEENYIIDFTKTVTVRVDATDENKQPVAANIIVDNNKTEFTTPGNLKLRPGVHTIKIQKDGFIATVDSKEILIENSYKGAVEFILKRIE